MVLPTPSVAAYLGLGSNLGDRAALIDALDRSKQEPGKPTAIIANTVKGKGVSFMEDVAKWHHGVPSEAELKQALGELDATEAKLKEAAK